MVLLLILLPLLSTFVASEHITKVFKSFDSLEYRGSSTILNPVKTGWNAILSWEVDGSWMKPGDTFTLNMPCVYRFTNTEPSIHLTENSIDYANCIFSPGDIALEYSELKCVLLPTVNQLTKAIGTISIPLTFNAGYSASTIDLKCSKYFHDGVNTVSFYDGDNVLSTQATFQRGVSTTASIIVYELRNIPSLNKQQQYLLQGTCARGYSQGRLGVIIYGGTGLIDCSSVRAYASNSFNDWYLPESIDEILFTLDCSSREVNVRYENVPAGYRVFLEVFYHRTAGVQLDVDYVNRYICAGSSVIHENSVAILWQAYFGEQIVPKDLEVVTKTWTGSTIQMSTATYEQSDEFVSVIIEVPIPTTTISSSYIGISTSYTTYTVDPGATATVIEYEPLHETTIQTSCWDQEETTTSTIIDPAWATDTVLIITPCEVSTEETTAESTEDPIEDPTEDPIEDPTDDPIEDPTDDPIEDPTDDPIEDPTDDPIEDPTDDPIEDPTDDPSEESSYERPTLADPIEDPTVEPTSEETTSEESSYQRPTLADPIETAEPTYEETTYEEITSEELTSEEQTSTDTTEESTTEESTTEESTTEESTTEESMTEESTTQEYSSSKEESPLSPSTTTDLSIEISYITVEVTSIETETTTDLSIEISTVVVTSTETGTTTLISTTVLTNPVETIFKTVDIPYPSQVCSLTTLIPPDIANVPTRGYYAGESSSTSSIDSVTPDIATDTPSGIVSTLVISPLSLFIVLLRILLI
ncbi:Agglutinin-like protein 1 [Spathaspora sp. JA1]|nr:Agglutinin-like protein 1 [Spathaspora sp. JA1]